MSKPNLFSTSEVFTTERGDSLHGFDLAYHTFGRLNSKRDNVIWVVHALTADSDVSKWWDIAFGPDKALDPEKYFIVCANFLGSPYGSTHPQSISAYSGKAYGTEFPQLSPKDLARSYIQLARHLGIQKINALFGPSFGGQQALEWAILEPQRIEKLVLIATNAVHSAFGKAFNAAQRMAIETDPTWKEPTPEAGKEGLATARAIAMISYRSYEGFRPQQDRTLIGETRSESYLRYQGLKLANRFPTLNYWFLSKSMDLHDVGRGRQGQAWALNQVKARTLIISLQGDLLFPEEEQRYLEEHIATTSFRSIVSNYGHDGFLIEPAINTTVKEWLEKTTLPLPQDNTFIAN